MLGLRKSKKKLFSIFKQFGLRTFKQIFKVLNLGFENVFKILEFIENSLDSEN